MNVKFQRPIYYLIAIAVLCVVIFAILLTSQSFVLAQPSSKSSAEITIDININLDANSKVSLYNGNFAYNNGTTLYVAYNNVLLSKENAFVGQLVDIAIGQNVVMLLAQNNGTQSLYAYSFDNTKITKLDINLDTLGLTPYLHDVKKINYCDSNFYLLRPSVVFKLSNFNTEVERIFNSENKIFADVQDFYIHNNTIYTLSDNNLFYSNVKNIESFGQMSKLDIGNITSFSWNNGHIIVSQSGDISYIDLTDLTDISTHQLHSHNTLPAYPNNMFSSVIDGINYVYFISYADLSIKWYSYNDSSLTYINSFDNISYQNPTDYDILKVGKLNQDTFIVVSPKNQYIRTTIQKNQYVLVFAHKDGFYYVVDNNGNKGYLNSQHLDLLEPDKSSPLGNNVSVLHHNTPIYQYPYYDSPKVTGRYLTFTDILVVEQVVATENDQDIWGWYKISYVNDKDIIVSGYIPKIDIAPYTPLTPPQIYKEAKIKSNKIGEVVKIYELANEESAIVETYTDGQRVMLAQSYDKSREWTLIQVNGNVGYIKTANLQLDGLTNVQITLIVLSAVVALASLGTGLIVVLKKKNLKSF